MLHSPEFWVAVGFIIFVAGIFRPVSKMIAGALDTRAAQIKSSLDEAAQLREEAQHLLAEYQRKQRDTAKEADELIVHAKAEAETLLDEGRARLDAMLARRRKMGEEKIALAEADATAALRDEAVDLALAAAAALIAARLDAETGDKLIDAAISEIPERLKAAV